ncbi:hypothetical protein MNBD_BACTEROID06-1657 [hydrothermal vent metagenome]|uniref:SiaC family regulatory phosphoprotein domain-containing protein n=1 Tax=hydrothermal vent metagenome TaxID=652676 RepID=A0A3B0U8I1_9ZZZZ
MEALIIEATDDTPKVVLDPSNNDFEFSGKSLPEDVTTFYGPVMDWLDEYASSPNDKTVVKFNLVYFNTASSKLILDILFKLEEIFDEGNDISIEWHYQEEDEDMEEAGEEYGDLVEMPLELKSYE